VLRLHDEVVTLGGRRHELDDRTAARAGPRAVAQQRAEIRSPAAEVVVHPHDRNAGDARAGNQPREPLRHRQRAPQQQITLREVEVVDDVDHQERDVAAVGRAAVQIVSRRSHRDAR
jgi:hypothetical protein